MTNPMAIRFFPEQRKKLKEAARRMRLSEQEAARKAIEFGLEPLERALCPTQPA